MSRLKRAFPKKGFFLFILLVLQYPCVAQELSPEDIWAEVAVIQHITSPDIRLNKLEELSDKIDDRAKYYLMDRLCLAKAEAGQYESARNCAKRLLETASRFRDDWNYGNAVHRANIVLGRVALAQGKLDDAENFLLQAGKTPGSPQLQTYGPDLDLARDLLAREKVNGVINYLENCKMFWKLGAEHLNTWIQFAKSQLSSDEAKIGFFRYGVPESLVEAKEMLKHFWGGAKLKSSELIQPESEKDRETVPISNELVLKVVSRGTLSGLALHCGVPWQNTYLDFMKSNREKYKLTEKQNSYAGVLHGYIMARTAAKAKLLSCADSIKSLISESLNTTVSLTD